jgi:hypothetical protein
MGMRKPDIDLHVERLVLHDIGGLDRNRVSEALGDELMRLLTAHGISQGLARGASVERVDGGAFRLSSGARPAAFGVQVARSVHRGLRE